jgi:hypothetical protein
MSRLETLDRASWRDFLAAPTAVLMLGKTDCQACAAWTEELTSFLAGDQEFGDVRFGKIFLDQGGLADFKRENPWIAQLDVLPYNVVYVAGERKKEFAGSGIERLVNRLRGLREG